MYYFRVSLPGTPSIQKMFLTKLVKSLHDFHSRKASNRIAISFADQNITTRKALNHVCFLSEEQEVLAEFKDKEGYIVMDSVNLTASEIKAQPTEVDQYMKLQRSRENEFAVGSRRFKRKVEHYMKKRAEDGKPNDRQEAEKDAVKWIMSNHQSPLKNSLLLKMDSNRQKKTFSLQLKGGVATNNEADLSQLNSYGLNAVVPIIH